MKIQKHWQGFGWQKKPKISQSTLFQKPMVLCCSFVVEPPKLDTRYKKMWLNFLSRRRRAAGRIPISLLFIDRVTSERGKISFGFMILSLLSLLSGNLSPNLIQTNLFHLERIQRWTRPKNPRQFGRPNSKNPSKKYHKKISVKMTRHKFRANLQSTQKLSLKVMRSKNQKPSQMFQIKHKKKVNLREDN